MTLQNKVRTKNWPFGVFQYCLSKKTKVSIMVPTVVISVVFMCFIYYKEFKIIIIII